MMEAQRRPASQMAGILCNDAAFAKFVADACSFPGDPASYIRGTCEIASRRELDQAVQDL